MDDTVGDEDIRNDNLGLVDKDIAIMDDNVDILALGSLECAVLQRAAVSDSAADNVVLEDALEVIAAEVAHDRANLGKGGVVGRKDGDVLGLGDIICDVGLGQGADDGREVGGDGGVGDVLGDGKNTVDDVDGAAGEVEVLLGQRRLVIRGTDDSQPRSRWTEHGGHCRS